MQQGQMKPATQGGDHRPRAHLQPADAVHELRGGRGTADHRGRQGPHHPRPGRDAGGRQLLRASSAGAAAGMGGSLAGAAMRSAATRRHAHAVAAAGFGSADGRWHARRGKPATRLLKELERKDDKGKLTPAERSEKLLPLKLEESLVKLAAAGGDQAGRGPGHAARFLGRGDRETRSARVQGPRQGDQREARRSARSPPTSSRNSRCSRSSATSRLPSRDLAALSKRRDHGKR